MAIITSISTVRSYEKQTAWQSLANLYTFKAKSVVFKHKQ